MCFVFCLQLVFYCLLFFISLSISLNRTLKKSCSKYLLYYLLRKVYKNLRLFMTDHWDTMQGGSKKVLKKKKGEIK